MVTSSTDTPARSLAHQPALDGIRALAIALVLCFHAGFGWMHGGYFGVSVFFTLSGFLITMLLLTELQAGGTVSLRRFYARRLPASTACVLAVLAARALGEFQLVAGFSAQMRGAVAQVSNWVQLAGSSSYSALFAQSAALVSPVAHYWSLAIEEQFYLLWPVVAGPCCDRSRCSPRCVRWWHRRSPSLPGPMRRTGPRPPGWARCWSAPPPLHGW